MLTIDDINNQNIHVLAVEKADMKGVAIGHSNAVNRTKEKK